MGVWQHAEEILKSIRDDLAQDPPNWETATRSTGNLKLLVPEYPKFQKYEEGTPLQTPDWDIGQVRADLTHLQLALMTKDLKLALKSAASALENVQALGRRGA